MKKYTIGLITGALLAVSAMMFMGSQNKNLGDIVVTSVVIVDENGVKHGKLGSFENSGQLGLWDVLTSEMIVIKSEGLKTYNEAHEKTSILGTDKDGGGRLIIANANVNAILGSNKDGGGHLSITNADGELIVSLGNDDSGNGSLVILNADGDMAASLGTKKNGGGQLFTFNADGKMTAFLGTDASGIGYLSTSNADGKETAFLGTNKNNDGMILLSDRYGDAGWSASGKK